MIMLCKVDSHIHTHTLTQHMYMYIYTCRYGQTGTGKTFTMEGERSPEGALSWEEVGHTARAHVTLSLSPSSRTHCVASFPVHCISSLQSWKHRFIINEIFSF